MKEQNIMKKRESLMNTLKRSNTKIGIFAHLSYRFHNAIDQKR